MTIAQRVSNAEYLELALRHAFPTMVVHVVAWPFPHELGGILGSLWDSDFCQFRAFQDARFRFLDSAASVLNCDVDELVISPTGASIFLAAEASLSGYDSFPGRLISTAQDCYRPASSRQTRTHLQFYLSDMLRFHQLGILP